MKRLPKYLLLSLLTFTLGLAAVSIWFFSYRKPIQPIETKTTEIAKSPVTEDSPDNSDQDDEFSTPLDKIWQQDAKFSYEGYTITKKCQGKEADNDCRINISKGKKVLAHFESPTTDWVQYGFFNLLGRKDKQLIIYSYSGGAHCCNDYVIYDLKPELRVIYDSRKFDSGSDVGDYLIPVDIDGDGIFEFQQNVMAFDYLPNHAMASFPPAIFAYDAQKGRYDFANKEFPDYVLNKLKEHIDGLDKWARNCTKHGSLISDDTLREIIVRETFLNLVYAGNENAAWEYFDENYNFENKEDLRKDVKETLAKDPTYKSIYGN